MFGLEISYGHEQQESSLLVGIAEIGWVESSRNGSQYLVLLDDLLDACSVDDGGNITGVE